MILGDHFSPTRGEEVAGGETGDGSAPEEGDGGVGFYDEYEYNRSKGKGYSVNGSGGFGFAYNKVNRVPPTDTAAATRAASVVSGAGSGSAAGDQRRKELFLRQSEYSNRFRDVRRFAPEVNTPELTSTGSAHKGQQGPSDRKALGEELVALREKLYGKHADKPERQYVPQRPSWWG